MNASPVDVARVLFGDDGLWAISDLRERRVAAQLVRGTSYLEAGEGHALVPPRHFLDYPALAEQARPQGWGAVPVVGKDELSVTLPWTRLYSVLVRGAEQELVEIHRLYDCEPDGRWIGELAFEDAERLHALREIRRRPDTRRLFAHRTPWQELLCIFVETASVGCSSLGALRVHAYSTEWAIVSYSGEYEFLYPRQFPAIVGWAGRRNLGASLVLLMPHLPDDVQWGGGVSFYVCGTEIPPRPWIDAIELSLLYDVRCGLVQDFVEAVQDPVALARRVKVGWGYTEEGEPDPIDGG